MARIKLIGLRRSPTTPTFCTCCIARTLCRCVSLARARKCRIYWTGYYLSPPERVAVPTPTVNFAIGDLMASRGWRGVAHWYRKANGIAPTLVGGSKKHGGPDLGPTRARKQWAELGIDGLGIANAAPDEDFPADALPRLTLRMAARIQAFPDFMAIRRWQDSRLPPNWQRLSPAGCASGWGVYYGGFDWSTS